VTSQARDPAALRAQAAEIRHLAQYADGRAYSDDMRRAAELDAQARALEAEAAALAERKAAADAKRRRELAQIHVAKKELGLDDDTYRDMLWTIARVRTAKELDKGGRMRVIQHLRSLGHRPRRKGRTRTAEPRETVAAKIRKQLEAQGLSAKYADGIAKRMFGIERWEWCKPEQLRKIVAALEYRRKREEG
jgi:phage gp16-like protein